jgi:hypothetical protein
MSPLKVEFHHPPEPVEHVDASPGVPAPPAPPPPPAVATATWRDGRVIVEATDPELKGSLERAFRPTPVVVDDASLRSAGTRGEVVLQPGDLQWFRAVAHYRVPAEAGLVARFVPGVSEGGFDPAANYRRFDEQIERLITRSAT